MSSAGDQLPGLKVAPGIEPGAGAATLTAETIVVRRALRVVSSSRARTPSGAHDTISSELTAWTIGRPRSGVRCARRWAGAAAGLGHKL